MFDNIGGKIKILAKVMAWVGIVFSVIAGLVIVSRFPYARTIFLGLCIAVFGSLFSWIGTFLLYGFGQLIENTDKLVKYNQNNAKNNGYKQQMW